MSSLIENAENDEHTRCSMEELRTSTRAEILRAWAEVERVEDEKIEIVDRNLDLLSQLRESSDRERALERQVEELKKLVGTVGTEIKNKEIKNKPHQVLRMLLADVKAKTALMNKVKILERENQELKDEFTKQLSLRETMLQSMAEVQEIQREMAEQLRQQLKAQEFQAHQETTEMRHKLHDLTIELSEKRKYIAKRKQQLRSSSPYLADLNAAVNERMHSKQQEKLKSYRSYVTDLKPPATERCRKRDELFGSAHSASTAETSSSGISFE
jgi:cell division FtsZ-interacting protein ZapD